MFAALNSYRFLRSVSTNVVSERHVWYGGTLTERCRNARDVFPLPDGVRCRVAKSTTARVVVAISRRDVRDDRVGAGGGKRGRALPAALRLLDDVHRDCSRHARSLNGLAHESNEVAHVFFRRVERRHEPALRRFFIPNVKKIFLL